MGTCPGCDGTRLSDKIRSNNIGGLYRALLLSLMFLFTLMTAKAQDEPPIVLSGDRTIIYIDRLPLRGDETLMDVLLMYPDWDRG